LGSHTGSAHVDSWLDPEAAVPADELAEAKIVAKKADYWRIILYLVFAVFGGVILAGIIEAFIENGDVEVCVVVFNYPALGGSPIVYTTCSLISRRL